MEHKPLGLVAASPTLEETQAQFVDTFFVQWGDVAEENDSRLSKGARDLKKRRLVS